jgi:hypothetical protein
MERLHVRFGFEIFMPYLKEAIAAMEQEHPDAAPLFNQRVFVNLPWESGLTALTKELQKSNLTQAKQLSISEKRLAKIETRKDPSEQLSQLKHYRDTDDRLVEEGVTSAVFDLLEGSFFISHRYVFQNETGDLDGMVAGKWKEEDVLVLCEAKHNMDTSYAKAKSELVTAKAYIERLRKVRIDEDSDDALVADYKALHVEEFAERKILFAFGGSRFSADVITKRFHDVDNPWFRVVANASGKFTAVHVQR